MNKKTAIVLGGTGLTGSLLIKRLVDDERYGCIKLFSRKASGIRSEKIEEYVGDLFQLEQFRDGFTADEVFCCIGTTSAKTKDRTVYKAIDYGIPVAAANLARANKISTFLVISSMGAHPRSRIFYSRTKGEMELAVSDKMIPHTYILRPSLILGQRKEKRISENLGAVVLKATNALLVGNMKKYRAIEADCIAAAMIQLAFSRPPSGIILSDKLQELGKNRLL